MGKKLYLFDTENIVFVNFSSAMAEFSIEQGPLSPESVVLAREELRETPERKAEAILKLRELLHENKDLFYRDDDDFLVTFLRPCKFYPESAIALVSSFYLFIYVLIYLVHDGRMGEWEKDTWG